jgi:ribosomal protein S27AE
MGPILAIQPSRRGGDHNGPVSRPLCPSCRIRPPALLRSHDGAWICGHCGAVHWRGRSGSATGWLWAWLALLGLGAAALPLSVPWLQRQELPLPLAAVLPPAPAGLEGIDKGMLFHALAEADATWIPRAELQGDGRITYHYKRRSGDPPLTLPQIRQLMADPPRFEAERQAIQQLLQVLRLAGVRIQLAQPRKAGAAAEWDPRNRTIRVRPDVLESGSAEFANVINHEAIHVAQSCHNGHVRAMPRPLGLADSLSPRLQAVLKEALYQEAGPLERQLEREAYANQHQLELGASLVVSHCRLARA